MKKVLIIAFFWPYTFGSKRVIGLAKFLPQFGWQPLILTAPLEHKAPAPFQIIETGYFGFLGRACKFLGAKPNQDLGNQLQQQLGQIPAFYKSPLRFFYNLLKEIAAYPDEHKNWQAPAWQAASRIISQQKIAAVISIWPVSSHLIAQKIKQQYRLPWLADFPDLWSQNAAYPYSRYRQWLDRSLEIKTLKQANCLTTSSKFYQHKLGLLHPSKKIKTIHLGFDPDNLNLPTAPLTKKLSITYTGLCYDKKRNPLTFFQALKELLDEGKLQISNLAIRFYGPINQKVNQLIQTLGLAGCVKQLGPLPLDQCLAKQRESQILLQLNWEDKDDRGVFSGKMLDYLAALRPILAVGGKGNDLVQQWLQETKAGVYCPTKNKTKAVLMRFYQEYQKNSFIRYQGNLDKVKDFNSKKMAQKFACILNQITHP